MFQNIVSRRNQSTRYPGIRVLRGNRICFAWVLACAALLPRPGQGQSGVITTIAGATPVGGPPVRGYSGDGGPATSAMLALANTQTVCDPNRKFNGIFQ